MKTREFSESGSIAWFVRNPVAANLIMAVVLLGGIVSMLSIEKNIFPTMRLNQVIVEVPVPGASPREIERGVLVKIEEAVGEIEGTGRVFSKAAENVGFVQIAVTHGFDISEVMNEISSEVGAMSGFPENARKPMVRRVAADGDEVITVQIHGTMDEKSMSELFQRIRGELLLLPGVSQAQIEDSKEFEISIEVSPEKMRQHGVTIPEVVAAIRANSLDLAGGTLRNNSGTIWLRTESKASVGRDFRSIPLRQSIDGRGLTVGDIAEVIDEFEETARYTRFDGEPSISLMIRSVPGENILKTAEAVRDFVSKKNAELPDTVKLTVWSDASLYLKGRINLMLVNLGIGALLVFLVLLIFLQFRLAFWVIIGIPVAFCGAIFLMPLFGVSMNMISIFGFILVLGIVVDDAIVIAENIHTTVGQEGGGIRSVTAGAQEVAMPATFGVITTIVAFIPMCMVTGSLGSIWMSIGMVVILSLVFSLVESKWILPAHLLHLKPEKKRTERKHWYEIPRIMFDHALRHFIDRIYRPVLKLALDFRYATVAIFLSIMALAVAGFMSGAIRFVFFPDLPSDYMIGQLRMAPGISAETTNKEILRIETALRDVDKAIASGETHLKHIRSRLLDERSADFFIELTPSENRSVSVHELAANWSKSVGEIPGAEAFTVETSLLADEGAAINIELAGSDITQLRAAGDRLKGLLQTYDGIYNVKNSLTEGSPEIHLDLKAEARASGLTLASVAQQIRHGFHGTEVQRIQRSNDEVRVMVRYPRDERKSVYHLKQTYLRGPDGGEIPFNNAVDLHFTEGSTSIERVDGLRVARLTAAADKRYTEPGKIARHLMKTFPGEVLNKEFPGITMSLAGQNEEEMKSLEELGNGFIIAVFCIYGFMAIPLRSYIQPIMIMTVIPFGFIGAIAGHLLLGLPISVLSLCGIIALTGVVVNDSIVFVDFVNRGRSLGMRASEAAREAGAARFRAILLTSLTTFIGLVPIMLETSVQAVMVIPMAVTLAFGILFSTLVTLFLLPTLYLIVEDFSGTSIQRKRQP